MNLQNLHLEELSYNDKKEVNGGIIPLLILAAAVFKIGYGMGKDVANNT